MSRYSYSTKVLIRYIIFTSSPGDGTAILHGSSVPREGLAACSGKGVPSFLSYFKTMSISPAPEIEPRPSALQCSTDLS